MPDQTPLAEIAYQAYGNATDHKNFLGDPMPAWDELPETIKTAWAMASDAILTAAQANSQIMDAFTQALQQANETGSATVGFRNGSAGGSAEETGYDITVVRAGGVHPGVAMPVQKPSLGRIVLVPIEPEMNNGATIAPAIITRVWSDTTVNLRVLADSQNLLWRTSSTYTDDLDTREQPHLNYWTWPPRV